MKQNRPTLAFIFVLLLALFWAFISGFGIPTERLIAYAVVLLFECWTIANGRKGDTISEGFWEFSARPLIPWACGAFYSWACATGAITVVEMVGLGGLQAHFFWQADNVYRAAQDRDGGADAKG